MRITFLALLLAAALGCTCTDDQDGTTVFIKTYSADGNKTSIIQTPEITPQTIATDSTQNATNL